jgi:hypothetical protein
MHKIIAATLLSLGLAGPAFAYSTRHVTFDPAAELQRATGSAQYPESSGGIVREGRISRGGSEAYPHTTPGIAHGGTDMIVGGGGRYPVLNQDTLSHPPTALDQDQVLTHEFDGGTPPASVAGSVSGDADG